jgi:Dolichyl-phosphate-mannose-protein mannosyltransferase
MRIINSNLRSENALRVAHMASVPEAPIAEPVRLSQRQDLPAGAADVEAKRPRSHLSNQSLLAAVPVAVTALASLPLLGNDFVWDDDVEILHNAYLGQWSFFWKSFFGDELWFLDPRTLRHSQYYRPLFDIWYALNYHLWGLNAVGWHAAMVAVHLLVVLFVFKTALALTRDRWAAFLAALLFGLMPIHVEAVGWVSATNVPSTAFVLAAFCFYIQRRENPARYWLASLALFAGGLLTYEGTAAFPALIAAYAFLLEENAGATNAGRTEGWAHRARRTLVCVAPFAAILLA